MTVEALAELREKLIGLRSDLLAGLVKEFGAGELGLLAQTQAALIAVDEHRDELRQSGDPGRE